MRTFNLAIIKTALASALAISAGTANAGVTFHCEAVDADNVYACDLFTHNGTQVANANWSVASMRTAFIRNGGTSALFECMTTNSNGVISVNYTTAAGGFGSGSYSASCTNGNGNNPLPPNPCDIHSPLGDLCVDVQ